MVSSAARVGRQHGLEGKASTSYVVDLLPVDWRKLAPNDWKSRFYMAAGQRPSAHSLLTMADVDLSTVDALLSDELAFVEVKEVSYSKTVGVYDLSYCGPHSFVA